MANDGLPPVDGGDDPQLELFDGGDGRPRRRRPAKPSPPPEPPPALSDVSSSELYQRTLAAAEAERARILQEVRDRQAEIRRMEKETGAALVRRRLQTEHERRLLHAKAEDEAVEIRQRALEASERLRDDADAEVPPPPPPTASS